MAIERSLIRLRPPLLRLERQRLWLQVIIGMILGIATGVALGPTVGLVDADWAVLIGNWVALPGKLFLLAIQFVVVPLVVASVIRGIAAGEGSGNLGRLGGWAVSFFVITTIMAVAIGLTAAVVLEPGQFIDGAILALAEAETAPTTAAPIPADLTAPAPAEIPELIASLFPRDPLVTFISGNMLQIVLTSVIIGMALVTIPPEQSKPLLDLLSSVQAACMAIVGWVLRFAPFAVFGLLAHITARVGLSALFGVAAYVAVVLLGLLILFLFYMFVVMIVARRSVVEFLGAAREAMLLAFSTSSSAAVMPVTLGIAERDLRVTQSVARFIIPLGTTINMAGTALYQGVAAVFLAQVFNIEIGISGMLLIVVMATGAAIGSPGTPGVGIVILATILNSVGIPPTGVAIILGVDRLLDMCRTVVNVTGDLVASVTVDALLKRSAAVATTPANPQKP